MDTSSLSVSHGNNSEATCKSSITSPGDDNSIDKHKLSSGLSSKLKINDENQTNMVDGYYIDEEGCQRLLPKLRVNEEEKEEDEEEYISEEELLAFMGYANSTNKYQALEESLRTQIFGLKKEPPKHEPITTPTADLNLVSAFKGSRGKRKEGMPAKERRVSWAPDVYDPPPNVYDPPPISKAKGLAGKNRQKGGGKKAGASEGEGSGGKGKRGGGSKWGVGKGKTVGKDTEKKCGDKKLGKKRGGGW